jgi:hypothetical protein
MAEVAVSSSMMCSDEWNEDIRVCQASLPILLNGHITKSHDSETFQQRNIFHPNESNAYHTSGQRWSIRVINIARTSMDHLLVHDIAKTKHKVIFNSIIHPPIAYPCQPPATQPITSPLGCSGTRKHRGSGSSRVESPLRPVEASIPRVRFVSHDRWLAYLSLSVINCGRNHKRRDI